MVESTTLRAPNPLGLPADLPNVGEMVDGKYRITDLLGSGGMGFVLAAENVALHQRVAIKFLAPEAARQRESVERFLREARSSVRIRNEHVTQVFDVGTTRLGIPYLVMELLEGEDLGARLEKCGALPPEQAASYMIQACDGLASAHLRGIVHRDLKPSNIFLTQHDDGSDLVKILDFGIAKAVELQPNGTASNLTDTRTVMGSPAYMSPEQIRSTKNIDGRTDVWSLGVVLQELLTRKLPFDGPTSTAVLASIAADDPTPLPEAIPSGLRDIILRCLSKDPATRIASVGALAMELAQHCPASLALAERALRTEQGKGQSQRPPPVTGSNPAPAVGSLTGPATAVGPATDPPTVARPHAGPAAALAPSAARMSLARSVGPVGVTSPPKGKTAAILGGVSLAAGLGYLLLNVGGRVPTQAAATVAPAPMRSAAPDDAGTAVAPPLPTTASAASTASTASAASTATVDAPGTAAKPSASVAPRKPRAPQAAPQPQATTPDKDDPTAGSH